MLFILAPVSHSQPFSSFLVPPLHFPAASSPAAMNYGPDGQQLRDELLLLPLLQPSSSGRPKSHVNFAVRTV
jgi:hypothetical protein